MTRAQCILRRQHTGLLTHACLDLSHCCTYALRAKQAHFTYASMSAGLPLQAPVLTPDGADFSFLTLSSIRSCAQSHTRTAHKNCPKNWFSGLMLSFWSESVAVIMLLQSGLHVRDAASSNFFFSLFCWSKKTSTTDTVLIINAAAGWCMMLPASVSFAICWPR